MKSLLATMRDRDLSESMQDRRGQLYRQALGHLTDEQWRHAVNDVISSLDWFPSVRQLLEAAARAPTPDLLALPDDTRTTDEKRADFRRGFQEQLRPALCAHGIHIDCEHPLHGAA
jgi:hypothetical protein